MRQAFAAMGLVLVLWGCSPDRSSSPSGAVESATYEAQATAASVVAQDAMSGAADQAASPEVAPQAPTEAPGFYLAYQYSLGLQLPGNRLAEVMDGHAEACRAAGPNVCQLISANREGDPNAYISGGIVLRAQPAWLKTFMGNVETSTGAAGGSVRARGTQAEDLTRQIVDTQARLTALRTLRDRLQALLASRPGRLSDLLEVERELARVQGELEATMSGLAVLRQRVDMSELTLAYSMADRAVTPRTFEPIARAGSEFLAILATSVSVIITLLAAVLPWAVLAGLVWFLGRWLGWWRRWTWPWGKRQSSSAATASPPRSGGET
jgi:hypothetical protein